MQSNSAHFLVTRRMHRGLLSGIYAKRLQPGCVFAAAAVAAMMASSSSSSSSLGWPKSPIIQPQISGVQELVCHNVVVF